MKHRGFTRLIALLTLVCMTFSSINVYATTTDTDDKGQDTAVTETDATAKDDAKTTDKATTDDGNYTERIDSNYTNVSKGYTYPEYTGSNIDINVEEAVDLKDNVSAELTEEIENYEGAKKVVVLDTINDTVTYVVNAPKKGVYNVSIDYLPYNSDSILNVEMSMTLNGTSPFFEAKRLVFESVWKSQEETSYDRYNNEIVSVPDKVMEWQNKYIMDASYRYSTPLKLQLEEGENVITFVLTEGSVKLGNMHLTADTKIAEYQKNEADGDTLITIEGEDPTYKNDSSIRPVCEYDCDLSPYESSKKVLNIIDNASFADAGLSMTYEFDVEKDGYYYFAFNYRQNTKVDFPVFTDVLVDGIIPNEQLVSYPFDYVKSFTTTSLTDNDGDKIGLYLTAGTHSISVKISNDNIREALESCDKIMSEINDLSLEIVKVAGTSKDKYRTIRILEFIPDCVERLERWANELEEIYDNLSKYSEEDNIGALSAIDVAARQLRSLAETPNQIPYRISELSTSTSSVNQYVANLITELNKNNLSFDRIYIYQKDAELPGTSNIFVRIWESIKRFIQSFGEQAYSVDNADTTHLQVWINRPRQYLEIIQQLIDKYFTPDTGIEVDLCIMPDANKLILANAAGQAPDVAQAIDYTQPIELAMRNALVDMTQFDDYQEVMQKFTPGILIPLTYQGGIYALPETFYFWVLYYRTDIMEKLGIEVPQTLEDVKELIPDLKNRGLEFFYPTAGTVGQRSFAMTTPILYQYGASLYDATSAAKETAIDSEEAIDGFTELTELFTIYDTEIDVPSFYQHFRNGDFPIGISDYFMYNMLINAAPEIENSWEISLVPGIVDEETGDINRQTAGAAQVTSIMKTDYTDKIVCTDGSEMEREDAAWEYTKWWMSTDIQVEFGSILQTTYGKEYIWNSANMYAFEQLPWKSRDKYIILDAIKDMVESPRIPGTYMVERELSNAYVAVVVTGTNLRTAVDAAIKRIDRETKRKLIEFGYIDDDGNVLKELDVPTLESVKKIIGLDD